MKRAAIIILFFTGLFGLKATFGRLPKGPHTEIEPLTRLLTYRYLPSRLG